MNSDLVVIRHCAGLEELNACVTLQKEVWNFSDAELVPLRLFVVAEKVGGRVTGGFDGDRLVAFTLAIPGVRHGHAYLHSHMLAVSPEYRNSGLGQRMKWDQRERALKDGFELIEWTFDPLEIKNSFLNIEKLGAVARRYNQNQYGITSSPLQGGLPSDRLVAEWWLKSERVLGIQTGIEQIADSTTIALPAEIYQWKAAASTRHRAAELQETNRKKFLSAFAEGLSVLRFDVSPEGDGSFHLGKWRESWRY